MQTKLRYLVGVVGACALMAGCSRDADNSGGVATTVSEDTNSVVHSVPDTNTLGSRIATGTRDAYSSATNAAVNAAHDVDNTAKNVRDRAENALTPLSQGESSADITTTKNIREGIVKDNSMSVAAKNIKIITVNGKVTLRGPVNSESEKKAIEAIAQGTAPGQVDNQLEIKENQ